MKKFLFLSLIVVLPLIAYAQSGSDNFIRGVDISSTPQVENGGGIWRLNGVAEDPLDIFKSFGTNYVRLRIWYAPTNGYCGLDSTLAFAKQIKAKGFKFLLDFHYSDTWADPGTQTKPAAWSNLPFASLTDSIYAYTKRVIAALKSQNTLPDMVQVGNEITDGMLWPDGRISVGGWSNFTTLLKSAIKGVKDAADTSQVRIMIHIDRGGNNTLCRWFFDNITSLNISYDVIGLSYYPWYTSHGTLAQLQSNLNDLATRYGKDIVVVETAYPWTSSYANDGVSNVGFTAANLPSGYPVNTQGQRDFVAYIKTLVKNVTNGKGIGFFYWEPADIPAPKIGSAWENFAMFDFSGNAFQSLQVFQNTDSLPKVKVTVRLNTATMGDTLKPTEIVQLRGQIQGVSSGVLPSGEKLTWDQNSGVILKNVGGDYWQYTFQMYPADELQFLFWTGHTLTTSTYRNLGWEGQVTPYDSSGGGYRLFTAGQKDTVLALEYYNTTANKVPQYWAPIQPKADSVGIYFRVNVAQLMKSGAFDTTKNGPVSVRGDSASSAGTFSWSVDKVTLKKEPLSVGGGTFWSGTAYFPKAKIAAGTSIPFKFFVENSSFGGWESGVQNRTFVFPTADSTIAWKFFNDKVFISGIDDKAAMQPGKFQLYPNFPNPFNPGTTIRFSVAEVSRVSLKIYDLLGREVRMLIQEDKQAGAYTIYWNGMTDAGMQAPSGMYIVRLTAGTHEQMQKMLLLR